MKTNKIIATITMIIIFIVLSGSYAYGYNQNVILAKYYYHTGEYQKASDLNVDMNDISMKALKIVNISNWTEHQNDPFMLNLNVANIYIYKNYIKYDDVKFNNTMDGYYKDIATYLGVTTDKLDEINKLGVVDVKVGENEIKKLLDGK